MPDESKPETQPRDPGKKNSDRGETFFQGPSDKFGSHAVAMRLLIYWLQSAIFSAILETFAGQGQTVMSTANLEMIEILIIENIRSIFYNNVPLLLEYASVTGTGIRNVQRTPESVKEKHFDGLDEVPEHGTQYTHSSLRAYGNSGHGCFDGYAKAPYPSLPTVIE